MPSTMPPHNHCGCFVTGGGYTFLRDGTRVSFGFNASEDTRGTTGAKGHLNFVVHGAIAGRLHLNVKDITAVDCDDVMVDSKTGKLVGTVVISASLQNGGSCTFTVVDNGEPGSIDHAKLSVNGSVVFDNILGGSSAAGGGNIQIHQIDCD
jgi:hypothetical protein